MEFEVRLEMFLWLCLFDWCKLKRKLELELEYAKAWQGGTYHTTPHSAQVRFMFNDFRIKGPSCLGLSCR